MALHGLRNGWKQIKSVPNSSVTIVKQFVNDSTGKRVPVYVYDSNGDWGKYYIGSPNDSGTVGFVAKAINYRDVIDGIEQANAFGRLFKHYNTNESVRIIESMVRKVLSEQRMTLEQAKAEAKRISKEEGVVQHVNEVGKGHYEISDWYDDETTVCSFENGRQL